MPEPQQPQKKGKQAQRPRHVPQRTCIVCRQVRPKRELIRVVRTPDGHILLDPTGKKSGRGAYLCARRSCWEPALHQGRLEREFEIAIPAEDQPALEAYLDSLPPEAAAPLAKKPARQRAKHTPTSQ
jgi:predicted RNA-binding protein YlxR (DUF448 family)